MAEAAAVREGVWMPDRATLGIDIGTSSSKGVLVAPDGRVLAAASVTHQLARPQPGWVEMDGRVWWDELVSLTRDLLARVDVEVTAVGVSGMGPCLLVTDERDRPLRPAILYGVDTRSVDEIAQLTDEFGAEAIVARGGSALSTQAIGPKLEWVARHEPALFARARRFYGPSSWMVRQLTGAYVLDRHSASQCTPMFDLDSLDWHRPWIDRLAPGFELPQLFWPGDAIGAVTSKAAETLGLRPGVPVIAGTIDAWAEAVSVGAQRPGDLMLMYGTTMFLICTTPTRSTAPPLWGTVGALPGTWSLAGGMATSGAITTWLDELVGGPGYARLLAEADASGPGARGVVMLPYFAGERTPVDDPHARGVIAGLTLDSTRGDLYRAALEATGFSVRHHVEAMTSAGAEVRRVVAVGGGTTGDLWPQIVSDITGLPQIVPAHTIGACYGVAHLAAALHGPLDIDAWNPPRHTVTPDPASAHRYGERYAIYRELYPALAPTLHALTGGLP